MSSGATAERQRSGHRREDCSRSSDDGFYLEEAAEILFDALQIGTPIPLTLGESKQQQIQALPPIDLARAWDFFKDRIEKE
jgi:hypothetical protein